MNKTLSDINFLYQSKTEDVLFRWIDFYPEGYQLDITKNCEDLNGLISRLCDIKKEWHNELMEFGAIDA